MKVILICICISKYGKNLRRLFHSIRKIDKNNNYNLKYLLLLNGINKIYIPINKNKVEIIYSKKKLKIPSARNKILKRLKIKNFDYCAFVDDDCFFKKNWITKHYNNLEKNKNISISAGPQISKPFNIYHKILEPNFRHGLLVDWCPTNNVFFKKEIIKKTKIKFNKKLENIGGSDQLFFNQLSMLGYKIFWDAKNPVYEYQNSERLKFDWFLKRNLRYGSSGLVIDKELFGVMQGSFLSFLKICYYLIMFIIFFIIIPFKPKNYFLKSLQNLIKCSGRVKSFFIQNKRYI